MRSVAGWRSLTCRRRKLKCDETRPVCGQCIKAGRDCELGELVFRHEQNSSLSRRPDALKRYFTNRKSFSSSHTWLAIPQQVTFVAEDPSGDGSMTIEPDSDRNRVSVVASSAVEKLASNDWEIHGLQRSPDDAFTPVSAHSLDDSSPRSAPSHLTAAAIPFDSSPKHTSDLTVTVTSPDIRPSNNIDFILNPISTGIDLDGRGSADSYLQSPHSRLSRQSQNMRPVETDPEVAFLLRHFSEQPGKWLDLYFLDAYFELEVPIKALSHPLLMCAVCAYAAKHLSRTRRKTDSDRVPIRHSTVKTTTTWPNHDAVDWAWHGAKYYAQAINLLRETLQHTHDLDETLGQQVVMKNNTDAQAAGQSETYTGISNETLAAMAILCNFEFMSASDAEWTRHLSGTMLVLDLQQTGVFSLMTSRPSKARKAIFWNFFRQDVYAAYILEGRTRLDLEDLHMWRSAGLELDNQGFVLPSNAAREGAMKDDMISNALIWILSKIFNHIATVKESQQQMNDCRLRNEARSSTDSPYSPLALEDRWKTISHELDVWYEGLPDSFQPCARIERTASEPATESSPIRPATIPDIWFTSAMCASTMQTYHLARMLLLVHKPQSSDAVLRSGAVFDFVDIHRTMLAELRYRSREIFGIALSSTFTSITLHQTQTIFIAAQCLVEDDERHMAVDILRRVNYDLGWETEYRVQQLLKQWEWEDV